MSLASTPAADFVSTLTISKVKRFALSPITARLRAEVLTARTEATRIRSHVDGYVAEIFGRYTFVRGLKMSGRRSELAGTPITCERDLWKADASPELDAFHAECISAHAEHGYKMTGDQCPALVAESTVRDAEQALLVHAGKLLGFDFNGIANLDKRREAVEVILVNR
jgi:hypothetical protein